MTLTPPRYGANGTATVPGDIGTGKGKLKKVKQKKYSQDQ